MSPNDTPAVDGRRRTWIKADVHYYSGDIGKGLRREFGMEGLVCFDAFLRACKVSGVEGQIRYASDEQFLVIVGLDPISWTNDEGSPWTLSALWRWLGKRHMTATRRQNGLTTVESRRWDDWQTRRSKPKNTTPIRTEYDTDTTPESEKESEREKTPPAPPVDDPAREAALEVVWNLYASKKAASTPNVRDASAFKASVVERAQQEHREQVLKWMENYTVSADQMASALIDGVPGSWNGYRRPPLRVVAS